MSFADLKRKSQNNFDFLQKELEKSSTNKNVDDRFWKPEVDASGNGYAVIRFLPAPEGETIPWAKLYSHAFQGPGGWYIENSLTTLGDKDPVGEVNRRLWNSGSDEDKETARKQKRKLQYYSNIYVVKDPKHPRTRARCSSTSMARRSMTRSLLPCNLSSKTRLPSTSSTFGKVLTSN